MFLIALFDVGDGVQTYNFSKRRRDFFINDVTSLKRRVRDLVTAVTRGDWV